MTKENITIAALRLFLLRGYKNVSLVDVANEAGITKGGIYHYFMSKDELLHKVVHYLFDRCEAKYAELFSGEKSLRETLQAIVVGREMEHFIQGLLALDQGDYRANYTSFALEVIHSFPDVQERMDRSNGQFSKIIEEKLQQGLAKGELRSDVDAQALAVIIFSMLTGQNSLGTQLNTPVIRQRVVDMLWNLLKAN
ncbi:MAG TPA: TetR/AcrR family transcriptional regulator [Negativicutes bacterium]|jgi:AcrR family transcriptional regulator